MQKHNMPDRAKVSPEFAARLSHFEPQQKIRVIVLLQIQDAQESTKPPSRQDRKAAMLAVQTSAKQALSSLDEIIKHFDGQCLVDQPDLLGAVPLEISVAGINALTTSEAVKAVIEDQAISPGNAYGSSFAEVISKNSTGG